MFRNFFVQAVGVAAVAYILFRSLTWALEAFARIAGTLARWVHYQLVPWSEEAAFALGVTYLVIAAVIASRRN